METDIREWPERLLNTLFNAGLQSPVSTERTSVLAVPRVSISLRTNSRLSLELKVCKDSMSSVFI